MASQVSFLYESELHSLEFNQRFADMLGGSVLAGYRFQISATPGYINLIRAPNDSSIVITNKGARIEETNDVMGKIFLEANDTPTERIDSIYIAYMHGGSVDTVTYTVIKGYPNGTPVPMMNKDVYTFLGYIRVPPNLEDLTNNDLLPVDIGLNFLEVSGKADFKNGANFEGPVQLDRGLLAKGNVKMTGDVVFEGKVTSSRYPVEDLEVVTKSYVDAIVMGLAPKDSVVVATTENISLIGSQLIDGIIVNANDRVLVKNQVKMTDNGIYVVANGPWTRAPDADMSGGSYSKVKANMYCWVQKGVENADTGWVLATDDTIELGQTPLNFVQFTGVKTPLASEGTDGLMSALDKRRTDGYRHTQQISEKTWAIRHNLQKYPSITVVDSGGSVVTGDVKYVDENQVEISFNSAFSGKAYCN